MPGLGDSEDTGPDGPDLTAFLNELPDFSEYVAQGGCPKEPAVVAGLGDSRTPSLMSLISPTASPPPLSSMSSTTSRSTWRTATAPRTKRWCHG